MMFQLFQANLEEQLIEYLKKIMSETNGNDDGHIPHVGEIKGIVLTLPSREEKERNLYEKKLQTSGNKLLLTLFTKAEIW